MKRTVVAGLVAALSLSLAACTSAPTASPTAAAGQSYKIGISKYVTHASLDASVEGFKKALADAGVNATYDEKNGNADNATVATISSTFAASDLDLVLAVATPSAQGAAGAITDKPVLFTAVTDPVDAKLVASLEAPGANVTGTSDMNPVAEQLALVKELRPDAKRVGILYSSGEANSVVQVELARQAAPGLGLELVVRPIAEAREMDQNLTLLSDVDAIYLPTDNKIVASIDTILQMTESKKIPLVVGEGDSVRKGGIVTYGLDYTKLGYQTGEMAIRILKDGAAPATLPVETQKDLQIYVNKAAAERMGVTIPESLLAKAEVVG
ncbi:MAG: ABC transporter substrate-binding protein [Nigerium sp.]|nr:ABC transporter substrate-binding protein [Nigerium sp.]